MRLPVQLLRRKSDSHKGDYGHLLIIGGSPGLTGAVCLAAQAALRIGAGLVTVGIPESLNLIFEIKLTEVMSLPLPETSSHAISFKSFNKIKEFTTRIDALVIGVGAAQAPSTKRLILKVIEEIDKPKVVDADGINALAGDLKVLEKRLNDLVLTPHLGEFSRLIKRDIDFIRSNRKHLAKEFALRYNLILVLKGSRTLVTDGHRLFENTTGNPGMATAGMGDVLTGIIGGLVVQGLNLFEAAKIGVYLHGLAGDYAAKEKTQLSLIASYVIEYLPRAIKESS